MGARQLIYKPSDTTRQSTVVLAADPDLAVALVGGGTYRIDIFARWTSGATPDFKFALNYNAAVTFASLHGTVSDAHVDTSTSGFQGTQFEAGALTTTGALVLAGSDTAGTAGYVYLRGLVRPGGSGVLSFFWAQNTSAASNTTVNAGAYFLTQRLDV